MAIPRRIQPKSLRNTIRNHPGMGTSTRIVNPNLRSGIEREIVHLGQRPKKRKRQRSNTKALLTSQKLPPSAQCVTQTPSFGTITESIFLPDASVGQTVSAIDFDHFAAGGSIHPFLDLGSFTADGFVHQNTAPTLDLDSFAMDASRALSHDYSAIGSATASDFFGRM